MKHFLYIVSSLLLISGYALAENPAFFDLLPSGADVLPEPPEIGSYRWLADSVHYFEAREIRRRSTADSLAAKKDEPYANWLDRYGADSVVDAPLRDMEQFPRLNELEKLCESMKTYNTGLWRTRQRPYYYFRDYYNAKGQLVVKTTQDSYPSGHGYFAGLFGLCMSYIDPENVVMIRRITSELTESRLILGAHWASDIEAGETLGAMAFAIALSDSSFHALLDSARQELVAYRTKPVVPTSESRVNAESARTEKFWQRGNIWIRKDNTVYTVEGKELR